VCPMTRRDDIVGNIRLTRPRRARRNQRVRDWLTTDTALGAILRLRFFISSVLPSCAATRGNLISPFSPIQYTHIFSEYGCGVVGVGNNNYSLKRVAVLPQLAHHRFLVLAA